MASMFGADTPIFNNPFVFDRSQILGQEYSPMNLFPSLFAPGGSMFGGGIPGQETLTTTAPTFPTMPQLPANPGLQPWDPFPAQPQEQAPVAPPPVPTAPAVAPEQLMQSMDLLTQIQALTPRQASALSGSGNDVILGTNIRGMPQQQQQTIRRALANQGARYDRANINDRA